MSRRVSTMPPHRAVGQVLAACFLLVTALVAACATGPDGGPCIQLPWVGMCMPPSANFCDSVPTDKPGPSSLAYLCNTQYTSVLSPAAVATLVSSGTVPQDGQCYTTVCAYSGPAAEAFASARLASNGYGSAGIACVYAGSSFAEVYASIMNWKPPAMCLGTTSAPKLDGGPANDNGSDAGVCAMLYDACVIDPPPGMPAQGVCCDGLKCSGDLSTDIVGACCRDIEQPCTYGTDCCGPFLDLPITQQSLLECGRAGGNHPGVCCEAPGSQCELALNECCTGSCVGDGSDPDYGVCQ